MTMTNKDKEILLKELCTRLPYGVIVRHADCIIDDNYNETGEFHYTKGYLYDVCRMDDMTTTIIESEGEGYEHICSLERTIPYLRPMSSMTEEERDWYKTLLNGNIGESIIKSIDNTINYLNANHFDYHGLIPMELALPAPEGMYNKI